MTSYRQWHAPMHGKGTVHPRAGNGVERGCWRLTGNCGQLECESGYRLKTA